MAEELLTLTAIVSCLKDQDCDCFIFFREINLFIELLIILITIMIITLRTTLYRLAPKVFNLSPAAFSSGKINRLAEEIGERIQR